MVTHEQYHRISQAIDAQIKEIRGLEAKIARTNDELAACQLEMDLALVRCGLERFIQKNVQILD